MAAHNVAIRAFIEKDISQVAAIEAMVAPDPWSEDLFASEFEVSPASRFWLVAEQDNCIVGFGGLMFATDEAHVMNMAVSPDVQRQGIARRLLAALLLEAVDRGSTAATLEVRVSNSAAIGFYEHFRFASAGTRPGYYQDGEDAMIMWAHRIYSNEYTKMLEAARADL